MAVQQLRIVSDRSAHFPCVLHVIFLSLCHSSMSASKQRQKSIKNNLLEPSVWGVYCSWEPNLSHISNSQMKFQLHVPVKCPWARHESSTDPGAVLLPSQKQNTNETQRTIIVGHSHSSNLLFWVSTLIFRGEYSVLLVCTATQTRVVKIPWTHRKLIDWIFGHY